MAHLVAEVQKTLLSPYSVSLKNLDSAIKLTGARGTQAWADSHPCQIKALAGAVLTALEFCPYALSVLEHTGRVAAVRDEMLLAKPALLDTLLRNSMQNDNSFDKYSHACLSILSTPLPDGFAPPATLVNFFRHCVEVAAKNTTIESVRSVYILVSNGFSYLSELLSPSQRREFSDQMARFVSTQGLPDTNTFLLMSIATLAHMALAEESSEVSSQEQEVRRASGPAAFFSGKKAPRVLQLVTNIVLDIAARDPLNWETTTELIRMATVIAETTADPIKQQLCAGKDAQVIEKLLEKTLRTEMNGHVISEVLRFVSVFHAVSPIPRLQETFDRVSIMLVKKGGDMFLPPDLAGLFATTSSKELVPEMMRTTLHLASLMSVADHNLYSVLQNRIRFLQNVTRRVPRSQNLRRGILGALVRNEFTSLVNSFIASSTFQPPKQDCKDRETCPTNIFASLVQLQLAVCTLILLSGLYAQADETVSLDPYLASALMEVQMQLSGTQFHCSMQATTAVHRVQPLSLFEASASPESRISSKNWRQNMLDGLVRETDRQHNFVIQAVGEVCRDLEQRCEGIEKPLRDEQEESARLRAELGKSTGRYRQLELDLEHRMQALDELEQEKLRLENKLDGAVSKTGDYIDRIKELEDQLEDARDEARKIRHDSEQLTNSMMSAHQEEISRLRQAADQAVMEHISVLNDRQDKIDDLDMARTKLEDDLKDRQQELNELQSLNIDLSSTIAHLEKEVEQSALELEYQTKEIQSKEDRINQLEKVFDDKEKAAEKALEEKVVEEERLKKHINQLNSMCQDLEGKISSLKEEAVKTKQFYDVSSDEMRNTHAAEISRMTTAHQDEISTLQGAFEAAQEEWKQHQDALSSDNRTLTKKLRKVQLAQERKEKEAQSLAQQLVRSLAGAASVSDSGDILQQLASNGSSTAAPNGRSRSRPGVADTSFGSPGKPSPKRPKRTPARQRVLDFRTAKASSAPRGGKENSQPSSKDMVVETPEEERRRHTMAAGGAAAWESENDDSQYGTGIVLSSTPKLDHVQGQTTMLGPDNDETMDF